MKDDQLYPVERAGRRPTLTVNSDRRPPVLPLPRHTVASLTLEAIRERILRGAYPEGEPLRQDALADELGVSRIPIREALRQLEVEGLVNFSPHRGAVVSSLSLAEIDETFSLRADIESDLVRRAAPLITVAESERADEILDSYERALRVRDISAWGELNWQFHSTLYGAADRPVTMGVAQRLHQQADRYLRMQLALTRGETRASEEHRAIAAAMRNHNGKLASRMMRDHILGAGRRLLEFLGKRRGEAYEAREADARS
jgi:DNA-binding GntR family transcriptional regulator